MLDSAAPNGPGQRILQELVFYTTVGCHLCEEAEVLLRALRDSGEPLSWSAVDIADDDGLFARYGWSIPVLRRTDAAELAWPFGIDELRRFVRA